MKNSVVEKIEQSLVEKELSIIEKLYEQFTKKSFSMFMSEYKLKPVLTKNKIDIKNIKVSGEKISFIFEEKNGSIMFNIVRENNKKQMVFNTRYIDEITSIIMTILNNDSLDSLDLD